jgi:hypothetical protein
MYMFILACDGPIEVALLPPAVKFTLAQSCTGWAPVKKFETGVLWGGFCVPAVVPQLSDTPDTASTSQTSPASGAVGVACGVPALIGVLGVTPGSSMTFVALGSS